MDKLIIDVASTRIESERERAHFSKEYVAKILNITIEEYEKKIEEPKKITIEEFEKLAELYKVTIDYLMASFHIKSEENKIRCPYCNRPMNVMINNWTGQEFYGHDYRYNCRLTITII